MAKIHKRVPFKDIGQRIKQAWNQSNPQNPGDLTWKTNLEADLNTPGKYFDLEGGIIRVTVSMDANDNSIQIHLPRRPKTKTEYDGQNDTDLGKAVIYGCGK